ncbi:MAG: hypothetical protein ACREF4_00155 [Gammaproteobacteria bacterium]
MKARAAKRPRRRDIKPIPPVGPKGGTDVRPIQREAARDYETGMPPIKRDPWRDESAGEPETNG